METTGNAAQFMRIGALQDHFQNMLPQLQQIAYSITVLKPPTTYPNKPPTAVQQNMPPAKPSTITPAVVKFAPMKQAVSSDGMYSATLPADWQLLSSGINGRIICAPDDVAGAIDANIRIPGLLSRDPQQMIRNYLKYISNGQQSGALVLNNLSAPVVDQKLQSSLPAMNGISAKCYDLSGTFTMNGKPYKAEFVVVINSSQFGLSSGTISYLWVPDDNRAPAYYGMLRKVYDTAQINSTQVMQQSQNESSGWANVRNTIQGSHEAFGSYMGSVRNDSDSRTKNTYAQGDAILGNSYWQDSHGQTYSTDSYGTKNNTTGTYVEAQSLNYNNFTGQLANEQLVEISSYDLTR